MENENSSPIQQLDIVLMFLAKSPFARPYITDGDIHNHLNTISFEGDELLRILNKLKKDSYVDSEDRPAISKSPIQIPIGLTTRVYWITWEGKLFAENDGYMGDIVRRGEFTAQEVKRAQEETARIKALELSQEKTAHSLKTSQQRMEMATWIMAGGSILLASIEILKLLKHCN